jgi:hypothetical protein
MTEIWHYSVGRNKRKLQNVVYSKKVIGLITGLKGSEFLDRNLRNVEFLW